MSKLKGKGEQLKKAQYYVHYLGWKECRGLGGREFTEPIVKDLVIRRQADDLPKLTIEVSKKELKIHQLVEQKRGKVEKIKYPTVPAKDLTYATAGLSPDEDVVATIYLGYNPTTRCAVHVHVYRCDSHDTADVFVRHLNQIISAPEHQARLLQVEEELVTKGQITPRPKGFTSQYNDTLSTAAGPAHTLYTLDQNFSDEDLSSSSGSEVNKLPHSGNQGSRANGMADNNGGMGYRRVPLRQWESQDQVVPRENPLYAKDYDDEPVYDRETEIKMESLNNELKNKLALTKSPILLPPKDYDTVSRKHGNLTGIDMRRSQNDVIVGAANRRSSGEDSARGDSESGNHGYSKSASDSAGRPVTGGDPREYERMHSSSSGVYDDGEIQAVSPRWKLGHGQYVPPPAGRPVSSSQWDDPVAQHNRARSPTGRAFSPVRARERTRSPPRDRVPAYERGRSPVNHDPVYRRSTGSEPHPSATRALSPERSNRPAFTDAFYNEQYQSYNREYTSGPPRDKKYTATNLGLAPDNSAPLRSPRYPDEGYTSMDRQGRPISMGAAIPGADARGYIPLDDISAKKNKKDKYKDKKQKKDKKNKKSRGFPGDEIPVDYTIGPAQAKAGPYEYRR